MGSVIRAESSEGLLRGTWEGLLISSFPGPPLGPPGLALATMLQPPRVTGPCFPALPWLETPHSLLFPPGAPAAHCYPWEPNPGPEPALTPEGPPVPLCFQASGNWGPRNSPTFVRGGSSHSQAEMRGWQETGEKAPLRTPFSAPRGWGLLGNFIIGLC